MPSSSSSSDESQDAKRGKKGKADKAKDKKVKKQKKAKKVDNKQRRRVERAGAWDCDRAEAVRLIRQLLQRDSEVGAELEAVFSAVDSGETVRIEGLEDKQARKKLRHLLQALRLAPAEGQGFRSANTKVSFSALFQSCLHEAKAAGAPGAAVTSGKATAAVQDLDADADGGGAPAAAAVRPSGCGAAGHGDGSVEEALVAVAAAPELPGRPRVKGPQLPTPGVGPSGQDGDGGGSSDEDGGEAAGPRLEGAERRGVDLGALPHQSRRERWMTDAHASIASAFDDGPGRGVKQEHFQVKRSRAEEEVFEKMVKGRGPSLLQQQMEGKFVDHEEEIKRVRKRRVGMPDVWGTSEREQERGGAAKGPASRRAFDPERDMQEVVKPIDGADFSKLVENSGSALVGRFSRGNVATSFL